MPITRGDLRTSIQRRIGDTSNSYGSPFYNDIIDSRTRTWGGKIAQLAPNYYLEHTNYTGRDDASDAAFEFYQFPSNYRTFIQLERQFGTGAGQIFQVLRIVNSEDQDRYKLYDVGLLSLPDSLTNYEQTVSVWDTNFRILPAPVNNSYEYRLKYIRSPVNAAADESNLDIPDEWQEVVILDSAIFILSQLGDASTAQMLQGLLGNEVKMLKDEYRRKSFPVQGLPYLDRMMF